MPQLSLRWKLAAAGLLCSISLAWSLGGAALGQPKEPARKDNGEKKPAKVYYGARQCNDDGCHGRKEPRPRKDRWVLGRDYVCRCDEYARWNSSDKHADAYKVLTGRRGKQMAKVLGYDVTQARECLVCHAVWIADKEVAAESKKYDFDISEGVTCVVCHGASTRWIAPHGVRATAVTFRPLQREVKESQWGMTDLWSPIKRTELCVSCHVGSAREGKFVSHEMYAAGHPPLPGFEVAAFSNEMPRHWQYLSEKSDSVQKEYGLHPGEQEQTKLVLVGAAVALRDTMRLLAAQAAKAKNAAEDADRVLDLSCFDCYACHHDLKSPSWRQKRGYKGKPGRVPMRPWPTALVKLAVASLATIEKGADKERTAFDLALKKVTAAYDARPYGDPALIEKAAGEMADWADKLARRLDASRPDRKAALALLAAIPAACGKELLDYDSARQVSWAFEVVYNEAHSGKADDAVRKALGDIDRELKLRLPRGREKLVEDELEESLKKINGYNPETFRSLLLRLGKPARSGE